ncbi:hypothetical protein LSTR_LSTR008878 [Laodelphax striatellus]|uniref:Uncharacterized protein n=1 Tax=Laodelphax striatellus TaxID=195883 RepID=A0A482WLE1_LAOST|nr:hypothetical protein LSTR_LSTR008878 [Laodelphax striatellus]
MRGVRWRLDGSERLQYAICLLTIFFIEIGVGTMAFVYRSKTQDYLSKSMSKIFDKYENNADARNIVNALQHELHCCGTNSPASWAGKYPSSCCQIDAGKHYTGSCPGETWAVGCVEAMSNLIRDQLETMGSIAMSVAAIEIVGIVASLCLASAIRRSERNYA